MIKRPKCLSSPTQEHLKKLEIENIGKKVKHNKRAEVLGFKKMETSIRGVKVCILTQFLKNADRHFANSIVLKVLEIFERLTLTCDNGFKPVQGFSWRFHVDRSLKI